MTYHNPAHVVLTNRRAEVLITTAAELFGVPAPALSGSRQTQSVAQARQACYLALRQACGASMTEIAHRLGRSNHTTVIHGLAVAEQRAINNADYAMCVAALIAAIREAR